MLSDCSEHVQEQVRIEKGPGYPTKGTNGKELRIPMTAAMGDHVTGGYDC